jgi:hypothetical protein
MRRLLGAGREHVSILAVGTSQPKLDLKSALPLNGGENAGADRLGIIGMNQFQRILPRELLLGAAGKDQDLPVAERHFPIGVGQPDQNGSAVRHVAEAFFAFA